MFSLEFLHILILGGLILVIANYLLNLKVFRFPLLTELVHPPPHVSVLIPARNEELRLPLCISTISSNNYSNMEILVLDDHSTDGTAALVQHCAKGDPRIRLLSGKPLPDGWTGKAWACQQLAAEAKGEYLLFVDADTRFSDITISQSVSLAHEQKADLLSLWPYLESFSWSEQLVIPFVHLFILLYMPHWARGHIRCLGAANGQFLLFRRDSYDKIKGHDSVRSHLVEDIAIARNMRQAGFKVLNLDGTNPGHSVALVRCRMYTRFPEVWEGFTKNLYPSFDGNFPAFLLFQAFQILVFLVPFLLLFTGHGTPLVRTEVAVIIALRFSLANTVDRP
ncbi:MAG: glycosyltransferase [Verrucomicrobia bacterium]|nr:glycosyltransferase [Verrucomicrobiota bacterium]